MANISQLSYIKINKNVKNIVKPLRPVPTNGQKQFNYSLAKKLAQEWAKSRDSRGSNSCVILVSQTHRSFLLLILDGQSRGANPWDKFVG